MLSPTLIDKRLKSCLACGDLKTMNSVLESLIFNLFLIPLTRKNKMVSCFQVVEILSGFYQSYP